MEPLKTKDVKSYAVEKLHFRFAQWGWMNVFFHDMGKAGVGGYNAGELVIHSDWGTWAYTWTGIAEGESLREFLVKADCDYLARKLMGGQRDKEWDPEATKAAIRKFIEEECPAEGWQPPERPYRTGVVYFKQSILDMLERCDWDSGELLWVERMDGDLCEFLGGEPWEHIEHRPTAEWTSLKEGLLPALKAYLVETR